jgi:GNAT superfamily N-acetyltransferase
MRVIRREPSTLHDQAFCLSSVRLWCDPGTDSTRELAAAIDDGGGTAAELLCVTRTRGSELRAWFPYIVSTSNDPAPLIRLLEWTWSELGSLPVPATAFVECGSPVGDVLLHAGWHTERHFPVQLLWPDLGAWTSVGGPSPKDIEVDADPCLEEVARLFVDTFLCEWKWYFVEMGYSPMSSPRQHLYELAARYVLGGDACFVARLAGQPVGLSSLVLQTQRRHAEFHTGVGVLPDARGLRLGHLLTEFTLSWAKRRGMISAEVRTQGLAGVRNRNIDMYRRCSASGGREFGLFRSRLSG